MSLRAASGVALLASRTAATVSETPLLLNAMHPPLDRKSEDKKKPKRRPTGGNKKATKEANTRPKKAKQGPKPAKGPKGAGRPKEGQKGDQKKANMRAKRRPKEGQKEG